MKKQILIGLISCLLIHPIVGQIKKQTFNLSTSFNVGKYGSVEGVRVNEETFFTSVFSVDSKIDYYFTDNWFAGLGFDFTKKNKSVVHEVLLNNYYQLAYRNQYISIYSPALRVGWTKMIFDKFYTSIAMNARYSRQSQTTDDFNIEGELGIPNYMNGTNIITPAQYSNSYETNNDLLGLSFQPEIKYFLYKNVGISVGLGGFDYVTYDFKFKNSMWLLNLNPENWRFGIEVIF